MLEDCCHLIDLKIAGKEAVSNAKIDATYNTEYINVRQQTREIEKLIGSDQDKMELIQGTMANAVTSDPDNEKNIREIYEPRINYYKSNVEKK